MKRVTTLAAILMIASAILMLPVLSRAAACNDGIDNDLDGLIDYPADPDCLDAEDTAEIKPVWLGDNNNVPGGGSDIIVRGSYAYLTDPVYGLRIVNISDPHNATQVGSYQLPDYSQRLFISGDYAYIANYFDGLKIIDISDPAHPVLAGYYDTLFGTYMDVYVSGNYAYIADTDAGLDILDVSDPANPTFVSNYNTGFETGQVEVSGHYAYIIGSSQWPGLQVIDVSNPTAPSLVGAYQDLAANDLFLSGSYAYIANYDGLVIIDISNPAQPSLASVIDPDDNNEILSVFVDRGLAYLGTRYGALYVINVTNPVNPIYAGDYQNLEGDLGGIYGLYRDHNYIFAAQSNIYFLAIFRIYPDTDQDEMPDVWERMYSCMAANTADDQLDYDLDYLTNFEEYIAGTNPCSNDTDNDGLYDWDEINYYFTDPTKSDSDGDGLTDGDEIFTYYTNPNKADTDDDGMNDKYEVDHWCLDPNTNDSQEDYDSDGLINIDEFNHGTDACYYDSDADGLSDGDEVNIYHTNPMNPDTDFGGENDGSEVDASRDPLNWMDDVNLLWVQIGSGTGSWNYPFSTSNHDARTQVIYQQSELGSAGQIKALQLYVITRPGQVMTNFTIRLMHTTLSTYPGSPAWEGSDWTIVYQNSIRPNTGWYTFNFSTPFNYNGTDNLIIDFSFNNTSASSDGACRYSTVTGNRSIYFKTNSAYGDPLLWSGTSNPTPSAINRIPSTLLQILITPTDTDSDGIPDPVETNIYHTNPLDPDTDHDGLNDYLEAVTRPCLDPLVTDSDGDGIIDGTAAGEDKNNNGIVDPGETDPCDSDTDHDGLPDGWEVRYSACMNPVVGDSLLDADNDGLSNYGEFMHITNPCNPDTDGGGEKDGLENIHGHDPLNGEDDDSDDDGLLNSWEFTYGCMQPNTVDSYADYDSDGMSNHEEARDSTNPCDPDTDHDGINDGYERYYGTNPLSTDTDNDGLNDYIEVMVNPCLNPLAQDTDGDGLIDGVEDADHDGQRDSNETDPCNSDTDFGGEKDGSEVSAGHDPLNWMDDVNVQTRTIGSSTGSWYYPFAASYHDARTQVIYLQSDLGNATQIISLALNVVTKPGQTLNNLTIRMKHTTLNSYPASPSWESGWTIVYQNSVQPDTGWYTFNFTTPFNYNGTNNLMVDFSFNNSSSSTDGTVTNSIGSGYRSIFYRTNSAYGDPLNWSGSSNPTPSRSAFFPNIKLQVFVPPSDSDSDGIPDLVETNTYLTNPSNPDTDGDGLNDYIEAVTRPCLDPLAADSDGDGLIDGTAAGEDKNNNGIVDPGETDPCNPDTDNDGVNDGLEVTKGTNPLSWDTDHDGLPDKFEIDNIQFDPLDPADGPADLDGDKISNVDEYWNRSRIAIPDPVGYGVAGDNFSFWADSGAGDGLVGPEDLSVMRALVAGDFSNMATLKFYNVIPTSGQTMDLDPEGFFTATDLSILRDMIAGRNCGYVGSLPSALELDLSSPPASTVQVGSTTHVGVKIKAQAGGKYMTDASVVFKVDTALSKGQATIFGGDGPAMNHPDYGKYRWDQAGKLNADASNVDPARVVIRVDAAGTIVINVSTPEVGISGQGRYIPYLELGPVSIKGEE